MFSSFTHQTRNTIFLNWPAIRYNRVGKRWEPRVFTWDREREEKNESNKNQMQTVLKCVGIIHWQRQSSRNLLLRRVVHSPVEVKINKSTPFIREIYSEHIFFLLLPVVICELLFVFVGSVYSLQVWDYFFFSCIEISKLVRLTEMWQSMSYSLKWFYRFMQIRSFFLFPPMFFCLCYCPRFAQKKPSKELFIFNAICVRDQWTCVRAMSVPNSVCARDACLIKMDKTNGTCVDSYIFD